MCGLCWHSFQHSEGKQNFRGSRGGWGWGGAVNCSVLTVCITLHRGGGPSSFDELWDLPELIEQVAAGAEVGSSVRKLSWPAKPLVVSEALANGSASTSGLGKWVDGKTEARSGSRLPKSQSAGARARPQPPDSCSEGKGVVQGMGTVQPDSVSFRPCLEAPRASLT